jgi:hypothetical protein
MLVQFMTAIAVAFSLSKINENLLPGRALSFAEQKAGRKVSAETVGWVWRISPMGSAAVFAFAHDRLSPSPARSPRTANLLEPVNRCYHQIVRL